MNLFWVVVFCNSDKCLSCLVLFLYFWEDVHEFVIFIASSCCLFAVHEEI